MNHLLQIELKAEMVNGNSKKNTPVFKYSFKTEDSQKKLVKKNRGRAIQDLVFWLIDQKITNPKELAWVVQRYDFKKKKFNELI